MRIYFTRHGESQANVLREVSNRGLRHGLTRKGRAQAFALAHRLRDLPLARVYSSPLLRAIETSVIVANQLNLDYEVVDALREYDSGITEGRSDQAAWEMKRELTEAWVVHKRWEQRIEDGESFYDIRDRFVPFVDGLVSQYGGTDAGIVCLSHGGVYVMMLPLVMRNIDRELLLKRGVGYTAYIVLELRPEGLVCVEWDGQVLA